MNRVLRHILMPAVAVGLGVAPGCRTSTKGPGKEAKETGITRTAVRGPVTLSVRSDRDKTTIAERFTLTITVVAEDGVDVVMPRFGDSLGAFSIRDFRETSARPMEGGKRQWQQIYQMDCDVSGKYRVEPITVRFSDHRRRAPSPAGARPTTATQPGIEGEITTEGFELEVTSLLEGQFDPTKFRDVKGPATLPEPPTRWYRWVLGGLAGTGLLAGVVWWWIRRRRGKGPFTVRIPPHEWAMEELRRLIDEDLIGQQQIKLFYYRLNGIVRQYIELRFGLTAPEMTTEEFLDALRYSDRLETAHKVLLENFLTACDMVKYACYRPGREEIEQAFAAARNLIEQTSSSGTETPPTEGRRRMQESAA